MSLTNPPKWPLRFLRWFCKDDCIDEIEGDLFEMYRKRAENSVYQARCYFFWNVLRSFRRTHFKKVHRPNWTISFTQTLRFIRRDGIYSLINAFSLTIGFIVTLLFVWYAEEELSYDQFHHQKNHIYRVSFDQYMDLGAYATTPYPVGPALKKDFPEVKAMSRVGGAGRLPVRNGEKAFFEKIKLADEDFFLMFDFPLISGNPKTALKEHNQVVISERLAKKYFLDENPIGKELIIGSDGLYDARISGVFKNIPDNSHIEAEIILSYATLYHHYDWMGKLWQQMPGNYTYVRLNQESEAAKLEEKLTQIGEQYVSNLERGEYKMKLIPLDQVHFYEGLYNENSSNKRKGALITFGLVVVLVLFIAMINFANLISSRYLTRIKEVGIRKVLGASRLHLLIQLLFQSFLLTVFSWAFALAIITSTFPFVNELAAKTFDLSYLLRSITWITSIVLIVGVTMLVAIIPAIKVSAMGFLKTSREGMLKTSKRSFKQSTLLLFQYLSSFFLMVSSIVMYQQLNFMEEKVDLGESSRIVIPINDEISDGMSVLEESLKAYTFVSSVAASSHVPSFYGDSWPVRTTLESTPIQTENFVITEDYLQVMSYKLLAGRSLNGHLQTDIDASFVVNETSVEMLGFQSIEDAIGQTIFFGSDEPKKGKIVGVVEDFHFESFRDKISPALFQFQPYDWMDYKFLVLQVPDHQVINTIEAVEKEIRKMDPDWVVEADFYEDHFKRRYLKETAQGKLATSLTLVAILLTCLGQVGLILHFVVSRQKEMAVRKVLGATIGQLWVMMTKSYFGLMVLAIVLAVPLCTYLLNSWLNEFYYRINLGPGPYFIAAGLACLIVVSVISAVALKSARKNPVESLSEE